jgi:hypothetical protein
LVAYAVVGWLVIQISSTVLPTFDGPEWMVQTLVVLVALGFPIALVIAWAFELTPDGIKPTEEVAPRESITRTTGLKLTALILVVGLLPLDSVQGFFHVNRSGLTNASNPLEPRGFIPLLSYSAKMHQKTGSKLPVFLRTRCSSTQRGRMYSM